MNFVASPRFLRHVLVADALSCVGCGALQLLFTGAMADALRLPVPLLVGTGAFLVAYAALAAFVAFRDPVPRPLVAFFVAGNFAWAAACVALFVTDAVSPSWMGQAWIALQAVTVVVLAELQWAGLRRAPVPGWA